MDKGLRKKCYIDWHHKSKMLFLKDHEDAQKFKDIYYILTMMKIIMEGKSMKLLT